MTKVQGDRVMPFLEDCIETRKQSPSKSYAVNVQIGPGDPISNMPIVIDFDHHQIHEGETFRWSVVVPAAANTNVKYIRFVVPNIDLTGSNAVNRCPHFRFEVVADAAGDITFYEGSSFSGTGTQRTPVSQERNGTYTPKLQIWEDPTGPTLGTTVIWRGITTGAKQSGGGIDTAAHEFVLKNNTTYALTFAPVANGTKYLIRTLWYEDLGV